MPTGLAPMPSLVHGWGGWADQLLPLAEPLAVETEYVQHRSTDVAPPRLRQRGGQWPELEPFKDTRHT